MDIGQGLTEAWTTIVTFAPRILAFLVILILGWLLAKLIGTMVGKALARLGLDRALERSGIGEYFQRSRYSASTLSGKIIYYVGVLIILQLAFSVFGPTNPVSQLIDGIIAWIPHAIVALIIIVVAGIIAKAARDLVAGALGGLTYGRFLANLVGIFIMALGVIAALNQIGVATTVTQPVLIAVLATVGGILVVGVGGGLVRPMQQRWSRWLEAAEHETVRLREDESYQAGRSDAMRRPSEQRRPETMERTASGPAERGPGRRERQGEE